jgi:spore germination protein YaaH
MVFPFYIILLLSPLFFSCGTGPVYEQPEDVYARDNTEEAADLSGGKYPPVPDGLPTLVFGEIWGYLVSGREDALGSDLPLTDVVYFGAEVDTYGKLTGIPDRENAGSFSGRMHLSATCNSRSLTHFVLEGGSRVRTELVADLLTASAPYDGLQIDFELVPARDGDNFLSFLLELREGLGDKYFTVALPARTRAIQDDVYDYGRIRPLVDRIFVMAYDEHWSSSAPGPVASIQWCRDTAAYALQTIGPEKLVMGLPFYGRTWGNVNTFRAFFFSGIERIKNENSVTVIRREDEIPTFTYEIPVTVTAYYDDVYSLSARSLLYRDMGVNAIGFWSLGQEDPRIWDFLSPAKTRQAE